MATFSFESLDRRDKQLADETPAAIREATLFLRQHAVRKSRVVQNTELVGMIITGVSMPERPDQPEINLSDDDEKILGEVHEDAAKKFDLSADDAPPDSR